MRALCAPLALLLWLRDNAGSRHQRARPGPQASPLLDYSGRLPLCQPAPGCCAQQRLYLLCLPVPSCACIQCAFLCPVVPWVAAPCVHVAAAPNPLPLHSPSPCFVAGSDRLSCHAHVIRLSPHPFASACIPPLFSLQTRAASCSPGKGWPPPLNTFVECPDCAQRLTRATLTAPNSWSAAATAAACFRCPPCTTALPACRSCCCLCLCTQFV